MVRLSDQLSALATMSRAQLRAEWRRLHRTSPPALSPDLLKRGIAYRLQEKRHGGLPAQIGRQLAQAAARPLELASPPRSEARLRAGTRLVRSWHGTTYAVTVTDSGFLFDERSYASLTAIAREITGAAWSGPRFFGLTGGKRGVHA
jgi:hypothetical protein